MTLVDLIKRAEKVTADNAPTILTALGVTGTIATTYLTGKATFKAAKVITDEEVRRYDKELRMPQGTTALLSTQEKLGLVWKLYLPPALAGTLTIGAIVCAHRINTKRAAALAVAYSLSEKTISEYKDKVAEKFGVKKEQEARDELAQERVNRDPVGKNQVYITGGGDVLCYDLYTGRYFQSSMETIKKAANDVTLQVIHQNYASLNDFYANLGLARTKIGEEVGWSLEKPLEIEYSTVMSDDDRPCIAIDYFVEPIRGVCMGG